MKQVRLVLKKVLIVYVIIFIVLSSMSSSFARMYDAQCGEFLSKYARDFISQYCDGKSTSYEHVGFSTDDAPHWSGGAFGQGTFKGDCTNGVHYMYLKALGVDITQYGYGPSDDAIANLTGSYAQYWEPINLSDVQAGDVVLKSGHGELYIGNNENADFGNSPNCGKIKEGPGNFTHAFRPKFDVNPTGKVGNAEAEEENLSIYDENGFIYSGVAKIQEYKGSLPFGKWIIKMYTEILDYMIGIMTLGIKIVIVGWTAVIERLVIDGIVNAVTGITNKRDTGWNEDSSKKDEIDTQVEQEEKAETVTPPQATGNANNPNEYISEGMQGVADIGGNIQLKTDSRANVTIENMVYNKIPILDVNFFNFDSAGGAVVDQNGIIYIIKENIAMWYYIFRTLAIIIMMMVLIYLGIQMAISTVAEKKAVYKEMLLSWVAGFILVFAINYVMYAIIYANETFISWIVPKYEDGSEISLYESVRSKAYELKATTGFAGMIMYIILVYYGIRFLIVYFKRYLTLTILALMSPFVSVMYAINKINKKGKGGEVYGNWMKDFMYTTWLQSIHALIYTLFISIVLSLTETSVEGIFISFIFLHFMVKMDGVMRHIFGFVGGKNASKVGAVPPLMQQVGVVTGIKNSGAVQKVGSMYGNFMGKTVGEPFGKIVGKISDNIDKAKAEKSENDETIERGEEETKNKEKRGKRENKREETRKKRQRTWEEVKTGAKAAGGIAMTGMKGALVIPMLIVESPVGIALLSSTISSAENVKKLFEEARKKKIFPEPQPIPEYKRYKVKGVRSRNQKSAEKLRGRFNLLGINYNEEELDNPARPEMMREERRIIFGLGEGNQVIVGPTEGRRSLNLKEIKFDTFEEFLDSDEILTAQEGLALVRGMKKEDIARLSDGQKKKLAAKLGGNVLHLVSIEDEPAENVEEMLEAGELEKLEKYMGLLAEAQKQEEEIEQMYKELTARLDEEYAAMEAIDPEFAKSMQRKKTQELNRIAYVMSEPLSEKDISKAILNYKSEQQQFNPNQERLSQQDIRGITKALNDILKNKGTNMQMSEEFVKKVEKELTDWHRRTLEKQKTEEAKKEAREGVGTDVSAKNDQKSLKEKVKELNATDRNNPYALDNPNAPRQGGSKKDEGSSVDRLVKNIRNASRGASSKISKKAGSREIEFAKRIEKLQRISVQAMEMTGGELYNIDDVLRRLEIL